MRTSFLVVAVSLSLASVSGIANAKGCLKGAAVGGVGGHVAGHHGLMGAAAGCVVGRHMANKKEAQRVDASTGRPNAGPLPDNSATLPPAKR